MTGTVNVIDSHSLFLSRLSMFECKRGGVVHNVRKTTQRFCELSNDVSVVATAVMLRAARWLVLLELKQNTDDFIWDRAEDKSTA